MNGQAITPEQTLGELVAEQPALAQVFEHLQLDYCCGGRQTLTEACVDRGLDPATVVTLLEALPAATTTADLGPHDVRGATVAELCEHIVTAHHELLRRELPRISELTATVARVHGDDHAELHELQEQFETLAGNMLTHLRTEEEQLFPEALTVTGGGAATISLDTVIEEHVAEHEQTGAGLAALRELSGGYDTGTAYCGTHRSLLEALAGLELDLHQHIHEENNILFPQVLAAYRGVKPLGRAFPPGRAGARGCRAFRDRTTAGNPTLVNVPEQASTVRIKRAYEPAESTDGYRVLIDRLWPRGVSKERARLDEWARELAPSTDLRRWFAHDPARFAEFRRRYLAELSAQEEKVGELRRRGREGTLTLVHGARDSEHNDAVVLAELLERDHPDGS